MKNELSETKRSAEKAADAVTSALLQVSSELRSERWSDVYYGHGALNARKWRNYCIEQPTVAGIIQPLVDAALAAKEAYDVARKAEKARLAEVRAQRASLTARRDATRAAGIPVCLTSLPTARHNFTVLKESLYLASLRVEYIRVFVARAEQWFESDKARRIAQKAVFPRSQVTFTAGLEFDGYLAKLAIKADGLLTGVVSLTGSLWEGSVLTLRTEAGEQSWSTKCILNFSVLGKAFNQWPTRRVE